MNEHPIIGSEPPAGVGHSATVTVMPVLDSIRGALKEGKGTEAARLFANYVTHRAVHDGVKLQSWAKRNLGELATGDLIKAFVVYPCFVCAHGVDKCDSCAGAGYTQETICEQCLGLGVCNCHFCGGSGWVTINFVPHGLQRIVIIKRIMLARQKIVELLRKPWSAAADVDMEDLQKEAGRRLVEWNRCMCILENALMAIGTWCGDEGSDAPMREKIMEECARLGSQMDQYTKKLLQLMAHYAGLRAAQAKEPQVSIALDAQEFYSNLAMNPKDHQSLQHPLLRKIVNQRLQHKK